MASGQEKFDQHQREHVEMEVVKRKQKTPVVWGPEVEERFLAALCACGLMMRSCELADVAYCTIRRRMARDKSFADRVEEAQQKYNDSLETEVHRRGFHGYDEPVFGKDGQIGTKRRFSDALAIALLKRRIPAYRDKPIDVSVNKGGVLVVNGKMDDPDEWAEKHNSNGAATDEDRD